jgi:tetratricopeptide (TPR) repeat protein
MNVGALLPALVGLAWLMQPLAYAQVDSKKPTPPESAPGDPSDSAAIKDANDAGEPEEKPRKRLTVEEAILLGRQSIEIMDEEEDLETVQAAADDLQRCTAILTTRDPGNPWIPYFRGVTFTYTGRFGDATAELEVFTRSQIGQSEWRAFRILGDLFVKDYPALAEAEYSRADQLHPNQPSVLFGLSRAYNSLGRTEDATKYARRAVNADDQGTVDYIAHLAAMLSREDEYAEATEVAIQAVDRAKLQRDRDPTDAAALRTLETQYSALTNLLRNRIKRTPDAVKLYLDLANNLEATAAVRLELAAIEALKAVDLGLEAAKPSRPLNLLEKRAELLRKLNRTKEAKETYEEILEGHPDHDAARQFLERFKTQQPETKDQPDETVASDDEAKQQPPPAP